MLMGIDIGGTKTAVVALGPDGSVVAERRAPSGHGPDGVVAVALAVAHECADAVGGWTQIASVGACMPGLVDPRSGLVTHALNLGVDALPLGPALSDALSRPVVIDNDVKAAGWGAFQLHGGDPDTAFGYLNIGTGLAAALVINGQIVRGPGGIAGEIGHLPLAAPVPCRCGQTGCLETSASGSGLTRMWPPRGTLPTRSPPPQPATPRPQRRCATSAVASPWPSKPSSSSAGSSTSSSAAASPAWANRCLLGSPRSWPTAGRAGRCWTS